MTEPPDPFEQELTQGLHGLVDGEQAPADLAALAETRAERPTLVTTRAGRVVLGAVAAAAVVVLFAVVALAASDDTSDVDASDDSTTTTESTTTSTTEPTTTTDGTTTTTEDPAVVPPVTSTTLDPAKAPRCWTARGQGSDNEGWEARWETDPGTNQAATVRACVDDVTPAVGQVVRVTLVGDDPDAVIVDESCGWNVSWAGLLPLCRDFIVEPNEPQPTPPRAVGHIERSDSHAYDTAGTHVIVVSIDSSEFDDGAPHPYRSWTFVELRVIVHG